MTDQLHIYAFGKKRKQEICEKRKIQAKAIRQMNRLIERLKKRESFTWGEFLRRNYRTYGRIEKNKTK